MRQPPSTAIPSGDSSPEHRCGPVLRPAADGASVIGNPLRVLLKDRQTVQSRFAPVVRGFPGKRRTIANAHLEACPSRGFPIARTCFSRRPALLSTSWSNQPLRQIWQNPFSDPQLAAMYVSLYSRLGAIHCRGDVPVTQALVTTQDERHLFILGQRPNRLADNSGSFRFDQRALGAGPLIRHAFLLGRSCHRDRC